MTLTWAVETERLTRAFGDVVAVDRLNLAVRRPEIMGLVGPDGAGKTTTLRMLAGILEPTAGSARILGYDVVRQAEAVKARIGYMPQRFSLYADLSVEENLAFFADIYRVPRGEREERMAALLDFARLTPFRRRRAEFLSGGMKQKLALACTLIHHPELLLLDEPTTGVDPVARREFWSILYRLLGQGQTILVSTPYMDEAERCSRVGFMAAGRLLTVGTPNELQAAYPYQVLELRARPADRAAAAARAVPQVRTAAAAEQHEWQGPDPPGARRSRTLLSSDEGSASGSYRGRALADRPDGLDIILAVPGVRDAQTFGESLHLVVDDAAAALEPVRAAVAAAGLEVVSLRPIRATMEDVFMAVAIRPTPERESGGHARCDQNRHQS